MKIHKYLLYLIVNILVFAIFLLPRVYRLASYQTTMGTVTGYSYKEVAGKYRTRILSRPIVQFRAEQHDITFTLPDYMKDMVNVGSRVEVIYDRKHPENAYVKNFYSIWGNTFVFLLPLFLIWTVCVFHYDLMPKFIKL